MPNAPRPVCCQSDERLLAKVKNISAVERLRFKPAPYQSSKSEQLLFVLLPTHSGRSFWAWYDHAEQRIGYTSADGGRTG